MVIFLYCQYGQLLTQITQPHEVSLSWHVQRTEVVADLYNFPDGNWKKLDWDGGGFLVPPLDPLMTTEGSDSGCSGGSKGGMRDAHPPRVQILSISCSFWENLAKSYVGAPSSGKSWIRHWAVLSAPPVSPGQGGLQMGVLVAFNGGRGGGLFVTGSNGSRTQNNRH